MRRGRGVRPETLALDALIKATIEQPAEGEVSSSSNAMLFLGTRHTSFPTLVVQDPVLEPVDKLVWMAIRIQTSETGGNSAFPSYAHIAKTANVSSTATISRAITILRATRWLTLCARAREVSGRFQGNAYVLHDEPLPLVDAIHLDSSYMQFLRESDSHRHARVKAVARGVLDTIDEDIEAGRNVCADEHPIHRRVEATELVEKDMPRRFFAFSAKVMTDLRSYSPGENINTPNHQGQNLNAVEEGVQNLHPQNLKSDSCSSYINITTTTNNSGAEKNFVVCGDGKSPLVYPRRLSDNQRELADRYLSNIPPDQRQAILDELEGRIRSEQRGMQPLYDELSFLHSLCKALKNGEFTFNLGIKVHDERIERAKAAQKYRTERSADQGDVSDKRLQALRNQMKAGKGPMVEIRKALGVRKRRVKKSGSNES